MLLGIMSQTLLIVNAGGMIIAEEEYFSWAVGVLSVILVTAAIVFITIAIAKLMSGELKGESKDGDWERDMQFTALEKSLTAREFSPP